MKYTSLYRKWRPKNFDEVKGRDEIITVLKNQIKNNMIAHAYLFSGTRGTGKTSIAKIFAKAVNCFSLNDSNPCGSCDFCKSYEENLLDIIEIDAASNNGVDNIRDLRSDTEYLPSVGKYKVYIIDEVHMLSQGAFNALLKTLEEPPEHVIFILATTELSKLPVTIISRCQRFDFLPVSVEEISKQIKFVSNMEGYEIDENSLYYLSKLSDGSFRDALSLLDVIISYSDEKKSIDFETVVKILCIDGIEPYHTLMQSIKAKDIIKLNSTIDNLLNKGKSVESLILEFSSYVKNLITMSLSEYLIDNMTKKDIEFVISDIEIFSPEHLLVIFNELTKLIDLIKKTENKRMHLDLSIMRMIVPPIRNGNEDVISRIESLEAEIQKLKNSPQHILEEKENGINQLKDDINSELKLKEKYIVTDKTNVSAQIQNAIKNWGEIPWNKYFTSEFMSMNDKYSLNVNGENLLILCHGQIFYHQFSKNIDSINKALKNELGLSIEVEVEKLNVKNKDGIDLSQIRFNIEKE